MDTGPYDHIHDLTGDLRAGSWPDQVWRDGLSCRQRALRIVLLLVRSHEWVARRVERVRFHDDRTVGRRVSTDLVVPAVAPGFRITDEHVVRLVPLTVLRRKTLVNFGLADVEGNACRC